MPIRRREKPLSPAEAIELAKKSLFPYWFGSEPLIAAARNGERAQAFPLDSKVVERPWLLFFIQPMALSSRELLEYARTWAHRYEQQKLGVIVVLRLSVSFMEDTEWCRRFADALHNPFITVMDPGGLMQEAFQADTLPKVLLLHQNQIAFQKSGTDWFAGTEVELQKYFRRTDPGLPLFEPMEWPEDPIADLPSPNIPPSENEQGLEFRGRWTHENDRMVTRDPNATLSFNCPGKRLGVIAGVLDPDGEAEVIVETRRDYSREVILDDDLVLDPKVLGNPLIDPEERKRASFQMGHPKLFCLFRNLPATHREITLRFPAADKSGVALYGLRFGN